MSGRERAHQAIRDVGIGAGTVVLAVALTFWGSLAAVQTTFILMTVAILMWAATTGIDRLRGASGWPHPLVFGGLATLIAVNASVFSFTGLAALLLSTGVLGIALIVGVTRVLLRVGS
jgi:hypothetical protein